MAKYRNTCQVPDLTPTLCKRLSTKVKTVCKLCECPQFLTSSDSLDSLVTSLCFFFSVAVIKYSRKKGLKSSQFKVHSPPWQGNKGLNGKSEESNEG